MLCRSEALAAAIAQRQAGRNSHGLAFTAFLNRSADRLIPVNFDDPMYFDEVLAIDKFNSPRTYLVF